ncbi:MAG: ABC transporter permease [Gammaproteobacteria bacterium]|nr:ABC transporter permease [Pseudomonadota bacterium]MCZ6686781.1 ABC transporter permease [Gammaproteobacteria bacterium]MCZ6763061.1 ABC transporter permease [Gammaproteobacteria bacterium]TDJ10404.1 MAG: ABC transporter permease [Gammaproteobacteria bacterium]
MIARILAILHARNIEFLRDRSALGWNILLPVLLVVGMGVIFSGDGRSMFKVAVLQQSQGIDLTAHRFLQTRFIDFYAVGDLDDALAKLSRHQMDMLISPADQPPQYWVNESSPKGYMLEKLIAGTGSSDFIRGTVSGSAVRYVDWLLPGILGMNMMFSCLFGVGYVVVRYRKNGFLKRLKATPLTPFEFLTAQVLSRLVLIMGLTAMVFAGTSYLIDFKMSGSYLALFVVATLGATCLISTGLLVAVRTASEELAGGLLNMISWPMMLLSGVWFSLEGTPQYVQDIAGLFPLTLLLDAARHIMLDGAGLAEVMPQVTQLAAMTIVLLAIGAWLFRWQED